MQVNTSIQALVKLIDDPDEGVFGHVKDQLLKCGVEAIPYLEHSWETDYYGLIFQSRVEQIIHEIQFEESKILLLNWSNSFEKDLLEGAIIVARYQYPNLDEEKIRETIQAIRRDIWLEINDNQTAFEQIKIFSVLR